MPNVVYKLPTKEEIRKQGKEPVDNKVNNRLIKYITFFGDSAIPEDNPIYKEVWNTAKLLAEHGYGVVDGGGPGIMKAATDGAESVGGETIAVYWEPKLASHFEGKNLSNVTDSSDSYSNYMMRTLGLIESGQVFVVCKGGTGTISEFGMVWAIAKLYYGRHKPVILFGDFWQPIIKTFQESMILDDKELGVLYYASTKEEVLNLVKMFEMEVQSRDKRDYDGDEAAFVIAPGLDSTRASYDEAAQQYHQERKKILASQKQLDDFISMVQSPAMVLDVGCGAGQDSGYLAQKYTVEGIDNSAKLIEIARLESPECTFHVADIVHYDLPENKYKGVWARDILHHIQANDIDHVFSKIANSLVDEGILYTIVREGVGEGVEKEIREGYELNRYYNYFSEAELVQRARQAGLELVKIERTQRSHNWLIGVFRK